MNNKHTFLIVAQTQFGNDGDTTFLPVVVKTKGDENTNAFLGLMEAMFETEEDFGLLHNQFTVLEWRGGQYPKELQKQFATLYWDFEEEKDETKHAIATEKFIDDFGKILSENCYDE